MEDLFDEIIFNDPPGYEDYDWIGEYLADLEYCAFDAMIEQMKYDIYMERTYGDPAAPADEYYETMDESEWVY